MSEELVNPEERLSEETKTVMAEDETLEIGADLVSLQQSSVRTVRAKQAELYQSAAQMMTAEEARIRMGAAAQVNTDNIDAGFTAIGQVKTTDASLKASVAGLVTADDNVSMEFSQAKLIYNNGMITMDHSLAGAVAGRKVKLDDSNVVFLLAGKVEGEVQPVFGPRESILFGIAAGIVGGILVLTGRLFKGLARVNGNKKQVELEDD